MPNMPRAITQQTTIPLPYAPFDKLQRPAWEYIEANLLGPGEELFDVKVDKFTETPFGSGMGQAEVIYTYWPAGNSGSGEK